MARIAGVDIPNDKRVVVSLAYIYGIGQPLAAKILATSDADDKAYVTEVYNGVISHYDELMEDIKNNAEKYDVNRLYKIDLAVVLLALYEIKYMSSIPYKVSVDEALSLAQKYSTEKSVKYINGVLSKFAR